MGFFGSRSARSRQAELAKPEERKIDFHDIGKNGTVEQFRAANKRALAHVTSPEPYDHAGQYITHLGADDQRALREGAMEAFLEGNAKNMLTVMRYPKEFTIRNSYVHNLTYPENTLQTVVLDIIGRSRQVNADIAQVLAGVSREGEKTTAPTILVYALDHICQAPGKEAEVEKLVSLTLQEGVPPEDVQEALNCALYNAVCNRGTEAAVKALLDVGADANAADGDGYKGGILADAVGRKASPAIIELLYKNGASFDDAFYLMRTKLCGAQYDGVKESLKAHAKKITGQPLEKESSSSRFMREIAELRDELTKVKTELSAAQAALAETNGAVAKLNRKIRFL